MGFGGLIGSEPVRVQELWGLFPVGRITTMADRYQGKTFPADDYRGGDQHDAGGSDPLAELARLIGQTDPFGSTGQAQSRRRRRWRRRLRATKSRNTKSRNTTKENDREEEPLPPAGRAAWMQRANARAVPEPQAPARWGERAAPPLPCVSVSRTARRWPRGRRRA